MDTENGTATANGDQTAKDIPQEKVIPYARFQEVVEQRKAVETALESLVAELAQDVPEAMRDLIPASLPAVEKAAWIRAAKAKGLFSASAPTSGPDAKRPTGKPAQDLSAMTPLQMMQAGYGQK